MNVISNIIIGNQTLCAKTKHFYLLCTHDYDNNINGDNHSFNISITIIIRIWATLPTKVPMENVYH